MKYTSYSYVDKNGDGKEMEFVSDTEYYEMIEEERRIDYGNRNSQ